MKKLLMLLCLIVLTTAGCAEVKYGEAKYLRIGDVKTKGAYVESIVGPGKVIVDPNSGLYSYWLDPNGVWTRFSFDSQESEGTLDVDSLAETVAAAVVAAMGTGS